MLLKNKFEIVMIVGARPQFIKAAMICKAISKYNKKGRIRVNTKILHTGQHHDDNMSRVFFEELKIPAPDYNLGVHGLSNSAMIGRMIEKTEKILIKEPPDYVIVLGDTNSTIAGSIASKALRLKVAHVEAGLRSYNMNMIEEQNRIVTDRLSDLLFCPTEIAMENLRKEGIPNEEYGQKAMNTGDVMYDSLIAYSEMLGVKSEILKRFGVERNNFILATIHRAENTDEPERLKNIVFSLDEIADNKKVVLPLHPRTKNALSENKVLLKKIVTIPPVSYLEMLLLEKECRLVVTDSGGVQKEAYFFKKPCITVRNETEWIELVRAGVNFLVDADREKIKKTIERALMASFDFNEKFYGNGDASTKIILAILNS